MSEASRIKEAVSALNADVLYVSAPLDRGTADQLRKLSRRSEHEDCIVLLTTYGGDADAAYVIARLLDRDRPNGFRAFITGRCKSAGTLLALGAREIVMGSRGELGPLDVQVSEKDEPFRVGSGLELFTTLNTLAQNTFTTFETFLLALIGRTGGQISMKAAAKIATELTVGIMSPISQQIDPLQLGRRERALNIAKAYAERLGVSDNVVGALATGYPDHGFVIDLEEARKLLGPMVRAPNDAEARLEIALRNHPLGVGLYDPPPYSQKSIILRLNDIPTQQRAKTEETHGEGPNLRGGPEGERTEMDGERVGDGAELHQADSPH